MTTESSRSTRIRCLLIEGTSPLCQNATSSLESFDVLVIFIYFNSNSFSSWLDNTIISIHVISIHIVQNENRWIWKVNSKATLKVSNVLFQLFFIYFHFSSQKNPSSSKSLANWSVTLHFSIFRWHVPSMDVRSECCSQVWTIIFRVLFDLLLIRAFFFQSIFRE